MEQGKSTFTYTVFPYTTASDAAKRGAELNNAPIVYMDTFHSGELSEEMSFYSSEDENAVVTAIKQSEDGDGIILRMCDYNGKDYKTEVKLFDTEIKAELCHNEIKTLKIQGRDVKEVNLIEY